MNILAANMYWDKKELSLSLRHFDLAYNASLSVQSPHYQALSNAIYLRTNLAIWGVDGTGYDDDMQTLIALIEREASSSMLEKSSLQQASAVFPHMTQAYTIPSALKLEVAKSHARAESLLPFSRGWRSPDYFSPEVLAQYRDEAARESFRIKIGYVSASMRSKAIIYLTQNIFGFHDRSKFEVHVFAACPPDDKNFLEKGSIALWSYIAYVKFYVCRNVRSRLEGESATCRRIFPRSAQQGLLFPWGIYTAARNPYLT